MRAEAMPRQRIGMTCVVTEKVARASRGRRAEARFRRETCLPRPVGQLGTEWVGEMGYRFADFACQALAAALHFGSCVRRIEGHQHRMGERMRTDFDER